METVRMVRLPSTDGLAAPEDVRPSVSVASPPHFCKSVVLDRSPLPAKMLHFSEGGPVARVTVEDCLEKVGNRFALVILAAERARQLSKGAQPLVQCDNKPAVTALREIAQGKVAFNETVHDTVDQY